MVQFKGFFLILVLSILIAGCQSFFDPESIAKGHNEVKQFLQDYPNSEVVVAYIPSDRVLAMIGEMRSRCGEQMAVKDYYIVKMEDAESGLTVYSYIDAKSGRLDCVYKPSVSVSGEKEEVLGEKEKDKAEKKEKKVCVDGTLYGNCSIDPPRYCYAGSLVDRCDLCGCPTMRICQKSNGQCTSSGGRGGGGGGGGGGGNPPSEPTCTDGTAYSSCSSTKPKYCSNGVLVNNCSICGCDSGKECQGDRSCMEVSNETPAANIVWTKYSGNPVLTGDIGQPAVIFDGNEYKMYYLTGANTKIINLATSSDGINWIKYANNPILSGTSGRWDSSELWDTCVLYDNGVYKMWYTGISSWMGSGDIGYATSSDGINWVKHSNNPVLIHGPESWDNFRILCDTVIKDEGVYKMWYTGQGSSSYRIGYATSTDGITWAKYSGNPITDLGVHLFVIKDGSLFKTLHRCEPQLCYGTSQDGIDWEVDNIPALSGDPGAWDGGGTTGRPQIIKEGSFYKTWYISYNSGYVIGYACGCIEGQDCSGCFAEKTGDKIVFASNRDGNYEIYVMDADGSNQVRLTNDPREDRHPRWSPDHTQIVWTRGAASDRDIWVMDSDGANPQKVTDNLYQEENPSWSNDGASIAFTSRKSGSYQVHIINPDGTSDTQITNNRNCDNNHAVWSADDTKLAFSCNANCACGDICTINTDGTNEINLINDGNVVCDEYPAWSSDGSQIAFDSKRSGVYGLYIINSDGTNAITLTNSPTSNDRYPFWANEEKILFQSDRDGNWEIYSINSDGTNLMRLTNNSGDDLEPAA